MYVSKLMVRVAAVLLFLTAGCGLLAAESTAPRPNIVIFFSDDLSWHYVGFNGSDRVKTPNIDRLAAEGIKLTQFYVQPVCSPSRASLMTGRYPWRNGMEVRPTANSIHGMLSDERTIAEVLRDAGYATWMTGKWHLGEWQFHHLPRQRGFDHHYGYYSALIDSYTHTRGPVLDWHRNGKPVIEEGYDTFLLANEASKLIREHDGENPFFLYLPFKAVHGPVQAPEEVIQRYRRAGFTGEPDYLAMIECMDTAIGQVMQTIVDKGIDDNTLLIYTNDNGGPGRRGNDKWRGGKGHYHEGGIRVPAAMRWPGHIPAGSTSDEMLHIVDLLPTLGRLAGADITRGLPLDGMDIWPVITKGAKTPHDELVHSLQVLRQGDWKLIEEGATYYGWPSQPLQLYNIRQDPYEKNNVAAEHPGIVERMSSRLKLHRNFARTAEKLEPIPGYPPVVYSQEENRLYGSELKDRVAAIAKDTQSRGDVPNQRTRRRSNRNNEE